MPIRIFNGRKLKYGEKAAEPTNPRGGGRERRASSVGKGTSDKGGGRVRASGFKDAVNRASVKTDGYGITEKRRSNMGPYTKKDWDNDRQERRNLPDYKGPRKGKSRTTSKFPKGR